MYFREEAESVEEDDVELETSENITEVTEPGEPSSNTDPDKDKDKETSSSEPNHSTSSNNISSSAKAEPGGGELNPCDLQEIRSNLQDAAREASDLLRDVQY